METKTELANRNLTPAQVRRRAYYKEHKQREIALSIAYQKKHGYPAKSKEYAADYRKRNREYIRAWNREYMRKKRLANPNHSKEQYWKHIKKIRETSRVRLLKSKRGVMEVYGNGRCACCGETAIEFLSLDHVNNDGKQHRKELKSKVGSSFYRYLRNHGYPHRDRLQVLCLNCNGAKAYYGICPHQKPR